MTNKRRNKDITRDAGGRFAEHVTAEADDDIFLEPAPGTIAFRSVEEDHEFFDAMTGRARRDAEAIEAVQAYGAAKEKSAWWRPGSRAAAEAARRRAAMTSATKAMNDSIIRSYTSRHPMPDGVERPRRAEQPDTTQP